MIRRLARPMLASVFVTGGVDALRQPGGRVEMARPVVAKMADVTGAPNDPELAVRANGALMAMSGLLLATGRMPRVASLALVGSLVPTTIAGHAFWNESDAGQRNMHRVQFFKNLGLLGGLLIASADTAGKPGLAWRAQNVGKAARREARLAKAQARLALR